MIAVGKTWAWLSIVWWNAVKWWRFRRSSPSSSRPLLYQVECPVCGKPARPRFQRPSAAPQAFGPRIQTLVTYLHEVQHVPYGRLETMLGEVFHLEIAAGSLVNLVRRTGTALEGPSRSDSLGSDPESSDRFR